MATVLNDRYRHLRYVSIRVTDDVESRANAGSVTEHASDEPGHDASTERGGSESAAESDAPVDFMDLSLPQRAFVAAVQNPTRGVVIVGLLAFAFSFYVAFWLVFPRVAAFMSVIGVVLLGIVVLVYGLSDRLSG